MRFKPAHVPILRVNLDSVLSVRTTAASGEQAHETQDIVEPARDNADHLLFLIQGRIAI
jgi:hypothetical protein